MMRGCDASPFLVHGAASVSKSSLEGAVHLHVGPGAYYEDIVLLSNIYSQASPHWLATSHRQNVDSIVYYGPDFGTECVIIRRKPRLLPYLLQRGSLAYSPFEDKAHRRGLLCEIGGEKPDQHWYLHDFPSRHKQPRSGVPLPRDLSGMYTRRAVRRGLAPWASL